MNPTKISSGRRRQALRERFPAVGTSDLQRQRVALSWTLDDLAARSGVARASIVAAEHGRPVTDATWWALARALRVPREFIDPQFRENLRGRTGHPELEF